MRKSYIATLLLLACSVVATLVIAIQIYGTRDDVVLSETVVYGDPSRADGLKLQFRTMYNHYSFYEWNTNYTLGNPDVSESNFGLYEFKPPSEEDMTHPYYHTGLTNEKGYSSYDPEDKYNPAFETFYEGKYYKFNATFDFPTASYFAYQYDESIILKERRLLQDYFKIPRITYAGDYYKWIIDSTYSDDMCYFTFDLHTEKGNLVDTSLLSDGFGIYAFPYEKAYEDEHGYLVLGTDVSKLEMIYALEPDTYISKLSINHAQNHLHLFTIENDNLVLHVIDIESRTELQKLILFEDSDYSSYAIDGALLVLNLDTRENYVISNLENQPYQVDFTFCEDDNLFTSGNFKYFSSYDGERLVYSHFAGSVLEYESQNSFDIFIAIYEKTGISYIGTYHSSLLSGVDNDNPGMYPCKYQDWPKVTW